MLRLLVLSDEVLGLEWYTKMGSIGGEVLEGIQKSISIAEEKFKGLVIANDTQNFSAGANVKTNFAGVSREERLRKFRVGPNTPIEGVLGRTAGDLLPAASQEQRDEQRIATGFLAMGPKSVNERNREQYLLDMADEQIDVVCRAVLATTVACARCHDHKFEPFSQRDYYRLQAVIYPAFNIEQWVLPKNREITTASAAELAAWNAEVKTVDQKIAARRQQFSDWARQHRQRGRELFADSFEPGRPLAEAWTNTVPGDSSPAGVPAIQVDQKVAPGAEATAGTLHLIESGAAGDRALSTKKTFDWTPDDVGGWIQVTFDLVAGGDTAPYVGYFIALRDFNDTKPMLAGGNILLDGAAAGQAAVHVDYPGADDQGRGKIGKSGYTPEYLPVLIAAAEAVGTKAFHLQAIQSTTNPSAVWLIVNGPAARWLEVNSGAGCLGQGTWANASLGRALRLILQNIGGALPGEMDKATQGQPAKYTMCCAENEAASPWPPLHVERGFAADASTVTVVAVPAVESDGSITRNLLGAPTATIM